MGSNHMSEQPVLRLVDWIVIPGGDIGTNRSFHEGPGDFEIVHSRSSDAATASVSELRSAGNQGTN
jgi:hypothetical protein